MPLGWKIAGFMILLAVLMNLWSFSDLNPERESPALEALTKGPKRELFGRKGWKLQLASYALFLIALALLGFGQGK